jgi:hypothetical protein
VADSGIRINHNNIYNNIYNGDYWIFYNDVYDYMMVVPPTDATLNWYDDTVTADISSHIYDDNDNSNYTELIFQPFLLSPDTTHHLPHTSVEKVDLGG